MMIKTRKMTMRWSNNNNKDDTNNKVVERYLSSGKGYSPGVFAKSSRVSASMMTITTMTTTKMTSSRTRKRPGVFARTKEYQGHRPQ